jgi:hypothetical protein
MPFFEPQNAPFLSTDSLEYGSEGWLRSRVKNDSVSSPLGLMMMPMIVLAAIFTAGCGATREYSATEQLVLSDAVDNSVSSIDFRPLTGRKVYLDTSYLRTIKGVAFVNADYVISALRQQIVAAGCLIQDAAADADVIVEARVGVLGTDDHLLTFGVPETHSIVAASSAIPGAPSVPSIPEIAVARRETRQAAAKVIAFAYDRETREPLWQSGVNRAVASANDTWVFGMGPFQTGTVRKRTKLAGDVIDFGDPSATGAKGRFFERPDVDYTAEVQFQEGWPIFDHGGFSGNMLGIDENEVVAAMTGEGDAGGADGENATADGETAATGDAAAQAEEKVAADPSQSTK